MPERLRILSMKLKDYEQDISFFQNTGALQFNLPLGKYAQYEIGAKYKPACSFDYHPFSDNVIHWLAADNFMFWENSDECFPASLIDCSCMMEGDQAAQAASNL